MLNVARRTYVICKGVYTVNQLKKHFNRFSRVVIDKIDESRIVFKLIDFLNKDGKPTEFPFYYSKDKVDVPQYIVLLNCSYEFHYRYKETAEEVLVTLQKMYTYANKRAKEESEKSIRSRKAK